MLDNSEETSQHTPSHNINQQDNFSQQDTLEKQKSLPKQTHIFNQILFFLKKKSNLPLIILLICLFFVLIASLVLCKNNNGEKKMDDVISDTLPNNVNTPELPELDEPYKIPFNLSDYIEIQVFDENEARNLLFEGEITKVYKHLEDLDSENEKANRFISGNEHYWEAGTFRSGKYKDWTRIVLPLRSVSGVEWLLVFITKDFQTFILDSSLGDYEWFNTARDDEHIATIEDILNMDRIIKIEAIENEHKDIIEIDDKFILHRKTLSLLPYWRVMEKQYAKLKSPVKNLSFYETDYYGTGISGYYFGGEDWMEDDARRQFVNQKINGSTLISVMDSTGLPVYYTLSYNNATAINTEFPSINFNRSNITSDISKNNFFEEYGNPSLNIASCGYKYEEFIGTMINLEDQELERIGLLYNNVPLYRLNDKQHLLLYGLYDGISNHNPYGKILDVMNFDEFISKNPLLFIKDPWGRWIALGALDFYAGGVGCGSSRKLFNTR